MEIMIRCDPKDEHRAIEYARFIIEKDLIPAIRKAGFHPTKYSVKYKNTKFKH